MQRYLEILPLLLRFVFFLFFFFSLQAVGLGQFELVKFLKKKADIFFLGSVDFFFFRQLNIFAHIVEGQVV